MGAALRKGLEFFLGNGTAFIIKNWPTEVLERPTEKQISIDHKNALTQNARIRIYNLRLNAKYFNELPAPLRVLESTDPFIRELFIEKEGEAVTVVLDTVKVRLAPKLPDARFYVEDQGPWIPKDVIIFFQDFVDSLSLANNATTTTTTASNSNNPGSGRPPPQRGRTDGSGRFSGGHQQHQQGVGGSTNWQYSQVFQRVWSIVYEWLATFHDISQMIKSTTIRIKNLSVSCLLYTSPSPRDRG